MTRLALPTLTAEQRAEALAKAAEARRVRSEMIASIKSGESDVASVFDRAKEDRVIAKTKVAQILKAVPGLGSVKVTGILEQAGRDPDRRVAGRGERQREAWLAALDCGRLGGGGAVSPSSRPCSGAHVVATETLGGCLSPCVSAAPQLVSSTGRCRPGKHRSGP